jgi:hypothetical protein
MKIISRVEAKSQGIPRYFTGEPCAKGHISQRWTAGARCLSCHYEKHPLKNIQRQSSEEKKQKAKARARRWYLKNNETTKQRAKKWKAENLNKVRESERRWRAKEVSKAIIFMRDSLRRVLNGQKTNRTENLLGYSRHDLVAHIEKQFTKGMSWENYGEWHIDHIVSVSVLISEGVVDPSIVNALSNLRPMWASENLRKHNKVETLL